MFQHRRRQFCAACREEATYPDFGLVCAPVEPKSGPITRAKSLIEKTSKTFKNDKILLISLDLTSAKVSNFTLFKGKIFEFFLFLRITRAKFS